MITKNKIKNSAIFISGAIIIIFIFLSVQNHQRYADIEKKWLAKKVESNKTESEIERIKESVKYYEQEERSFRKHLFEDQDVPTFLEGISKIAEETNVNILDMKTKKFVEVTVQDKTKSLRKTKKRKKNKKAAQKDEQTQTLAAMPINIKVQSTFASFVNFLGQLEDFKQLLSISNVTISSNKKYPLLNCNFTLRIYSLKTLKELSKK